MKKTLLACAIATFAIGCASTQAGNSSSASEVLTTPAGMTLYTFDKDQKDSSNCNGNCAQNWPPYSAKESDSAAHDFSVIKRNDGSLQWAYEGKPLYTFKGDHSTGDATGNGMGGVWHTLESEEESYEKAATKSSYSYGNGGY